MFADDDLIKAHKERADGIANIIMFAFFIILIRLWYLQVYMGDTLYQYSLENSLRKEVIRAPRGLIYSRNNQLLVYNIPRFDLVVIPQYLKEKEKEKTMKYLASVIGMSSKQIKKVLKKSSTQARYRPVTIKKNLSSKEVAIIETESFRLPGVAVDVFISRHYKDDDVGAHLLGYISEISQNQLPKYRERDGVNYTLGSFIGQSGVEKEFDKYLRGEDGHEFVEVDARGRRKSGIKVRNDIFGDIKDVKAEAGNNIRLTIDRDVQLEAYKSLEGKVGSAVAVDIHTGEILAYVSRPSYSPAKFNTGISTKDWRELMDNPNNPMWDRVIQNHYSPGSVFKIFTAIAALEEGIIKPDQEVMCKGTFRLGRRVYHDWKRGGHGKTDLYKSIKRSVDVYYYKIAAQLDIDLLAKHAKDFGFGQRTGIELPRETSGLIPTKEWKQKRFGIPWQLGETLSSAIGQSFINVTPIQLVLAYAAIANGGKLYRPYVIKEIFNNSGDIVKKFKPELVREVSTSPEILANIRKGLYQVANERKGTAWWYRGRGIEMAGKTGTSQVRSMTSKELFSKCEDMPYTSRHHGLFVAFAPYRDPKIAVVVVAEHSCHGSSGAAPVVRNIITKYMKKYWPKLHNEIAEEERAIARKEANRLAKKKRELEALEKAKAEKTETSDSE